MVTGVQKQNQNFKSLGFERAGESQGYLAKMQTLIQLSKEVLGDAELRVHRHTLNKALRPWWS